MYGQRRSTVTAPLAIKLVNTTICKVVTDIYMVASPDPMLSVSRRECTVKSQLLIDQNFCGIGLEHTALQSPRRRTNV